MLLLAAVLVAAACWYAMLRAGRRRMYELSKAVTNMPQLPIIGHLHFVLGDTKDIMTSLIDFSYTATRNGGVTAIWLGHLLYFFVTDAVDIEFVLKSCLEKDDLHRFIRKITGNGIVFAPLSIWRRRRKVMVPAFSPKIIDTFVEVFSEQSEILAKQIEKRMGDKPFDAWPFFSSYTLDSVSETVMGMKIKAQSTYDAPFLSAMTKALNLVCERIFHLWQQPDWLYRFTPSFKQHQHYISILHKFTDDVIASKRLELEKKEVNGEVTEENDAEKRKTFLDLLIMQSSKERGYNDTELREEVLSLTVAGTDTSAVGICFTLVLLGQHQDVQERVYQELLDVYGCSDTPLVKEDLPKLVYLERVIRESLRLYPPVPFIIRKVENEITLPCGTKIPAGSGIPISIWGVHRNPKYWGADAEEFDPDRFSPERYGSIHPCAFMPFSGSPRNCLGYQYALMSMKTSIAAVLRKYKVTVAEDVGKGQIPVKVDVMMKAADGWNIMLEPRMHCNNNN